jgi:hypothetical protein
MLMAFRAQMSGVRHLLITWLSASSVDESRGHFCAGALT